MAKAKDIINMAINRIAPAPDAAKNFAALQAQVEKHINEAFSVRVQPNSPRRTAGEAQMRQRAMQLEFARLAGMGACLGVCQPQRPRKHVDSRIVEPKQLTG